MPMHRSLGRQSTPVPITVANGDGIGPEIMEASLRIFEWAGAHLTIETMDIGERAFRQGHLSGIEPAAWESLRRTRVLYKAPITTPDGSGRENFRASVRKTLGLYASVHPCVSYHPFITTKHPNLNAVVIRGYGEYPDTCVEERRADQYEKIIRYSFEYARQNSRGKVTCFTRESVSKPTHALFHQMFDAVAAGYPTIDSDHVMLDVGEVNRLGTPESYEVVVTPDRLDDVFGADSARIAGSVGMVAMGNIGEQAAIFEAIHGSAPLRAGQNLPNPSGLFLAGVMMLAHIGQPEVAARAHNAWLRTIEDGIHTYDIFTAGVSRHRMGTSEFAGAVIARMGDMPRTLRPVQYASEIPLKRSMPMPKPKISRQIVGVDVYLDWPKGMPGQLGAALASVGDARLPLTMVTRLSPNDRLSEIADAWTADGWRCRFQADHGATIEHSQIVALLNRIQQAGFDFTKTESICVFDN